MFRLSEGLVFNNQEVRDILGEIVMRPEFVLSRLAVSGIDSAAAVLERLLSGIIGTDGRIEWWGYPILLLSVTGFFLLLFFVVSRLSRAFSPERALGREDAAEAGSMDYNIYRETAAKYAETGEFREAVRYLYLSLLLFLDGQQLIRYRTSKTNRDYLGELKKSGEPERFAGVVNFFERKWYGMENCTDSDYREFRAMYLSLVSDWRGSYQKS